MGGSCKESEPGYNRSSGDDGVCFEVKLPNILFDNIPFHIDDEGRKLSVTKKGRRQNVAVQNKSMSEPVDVNCKKSIMGKSFEETGYIKVLQSDGQDVQERKEMRSNVTMVEGETQHEGICEAHMHPSWGLSLCPEALQGVQDLGRKDLQEQLLEAKYGIMALRLEQGADVWTAAARAVNPYELVPAVGSKKVINRAYYKMKEMIQAFNLVPPCDGVTIFSSAHLCEGPGGFIEATVDSWSSDCASRNGLRDKKRKREDMEGQERSIKERGQKDMLVEHEKDEGVFCFNSQNIRCGGKEDDWIQDKEVRRSQVGDDWSNEGGLSVRMNCNCGRLGCESQNLTSQRKTGGKDSHGCGGWETSSIISRCPHIWFGITLRSTKNFVKEKTPNEYIVSPTEQDVPDYLAFQEKKLVGAHRNGESKRQQGDIDVLLKECIPGHAEVPYEDSCSNREEHLISMENLVEKLQTNKVQKLSRVLLCQSEATDDCLPFQRRNSESVPVKGHIHYGKDGTGDLTKAANVDAFSRFVILRTKGNGVGLVTGDGGLDVSEDFGTQEQQHSQLVFAQVLTALQVQAMGGSFVLKLFGCFTKATTAILAILSSFYSDVRLVRLKMTRVCSSECYVVAHNFLGCPYWPQEKAEKPKYADVMNDTSKIMEDFCDKNETKKLESTLRKIVEDMHAMFEVWEFKGAKSINLAPMLVNELPYNFLSAISGFNTRLMEQEKQMIMSALTLATEWIDTLPSQQCKKLRKKAIWICEQKAMTETCKLDRAAKFCKWLGVET